MSIIIRNGTANAITSYRQTCLGRNRSARCPLTRAAGAIVAIGAPVARSFASVPALAALAPVALWALAPTPATVPV